MYAHFRNRRFYKFTCGTPTYPAKVTFRLHHRFIVLNNEQMQALGEFGSGEMVAVLREDNAIEVVRFDSSKAQAAARLADHLELIYPKQAIE